MNSDNKYVCLHLQLTREDIIKAIIDKDLKTVEEIQDETNAGTVCGTCLGEIRTILEETLKEVPSKKTQ